jgi:hypothetical protein
MPHIEEGQKLAVQEIVTKSYDPNVVRAVLKKVYTEG